MNITPLFLTSGVAKLVRSPIRPDILRNLFPGHFRRLTRHDKSGMGLNQVRGRSLGRGRGCLLSHGGYCFTE